MEGADLLHALEGLVEEVDAEVDRVHGVVVVLQHGQHRVGAAHVLVLERHGDAVLDVHGRELPQEGVHEAAPGAREHRGLDRRLEGQEEGAGGPALGVPDEEELIHVHHRGGSRREGRVGEDQGLPEAEHGEVVRGALDEVAQRGLGVAEVEHQGVGVDLGVPLPRPVHHLVVAQDHEARVPVVGLGVRVPDHRLGEHPRDPGAHVAAVGPAGAVGVQDQGPARHGHGRFLGHREREADLLDALLLGLARGIELHPAAVDGVVVGQGARLELGQAGLALELIEPGVRREAAPDMLLTGEAVVAGRGHALAAEDHLRDLRHALVRQDLPGLLDQGAGIVGGEDRGADDVVRGEPEVRGRGVGQVRAQGGVGLPRAAQVLVPGLLVPQHRDEVRVLAVGAVGAALLRGARGDRVGDQGHVGMQRLEGAGPGHGDRQVVVADVLAPAGVEGPVDRPGGPVVVPLGIGDVQQEHVLPVALGHHGLLEGIRRRDAEPEEDHGVRAVRAEVSLHHLDDPLREVHPHDPGPRRRVPVQEEVAVLDPRVVGEGEAVELLHGLAAARDLEEDPGGIPDLRARRAGRAQEGRELDAEEAADHVPRRGLPAGEAPEALVGVLAGLADVLVALGLAGAGEAHGLAVEALLAVQVRGADVPLLPVALGLAGLGLGQVLEVGSADEIVTALRADHAGHVHEARPRGLAGAVLAGEAAAAVSVLGAGLADALAQGEDVGRDVGLVQLQDAAGLLELAAARRGERDDQEEEEVALSHVKFSSCVRGQVSNTIVGSRPRAVNRPERPRALRAGGRGRAAGSAPAGASGPCAPPGPRG